MLIKRDRDLFSLLSLVGFEVMVVVAVHLVGRSPSIGVGWSDPAGWLAVSSVDQVLVSMVWLAVTAMAWWTFGSTLLYLAARLWGRRRVLRIAERLVAPAFRRTVDRALAAALAGTVLLGPAAPALAGEPDAFGALTGEPPASEYEPQPAGSEQPPVNTPVPRKAPKPVEQRLSDDKEADQEEPKEPDTSEDARNEKKPDRKKDKESGEATRSGDGAAETPTEEETGMETDTAQETADTANRAAVEAMTASGEPDGDRASEEAGEAQPDDAAEQGADDGAEDPTDQREAAQDGSDASAADEQPSRPRPGRRYTVRVGDHLWKIASEVVAGGNATADRSAVAAYWAALVREAKPHLRSGNPDMIYPGERITLPPLPEREQGEGERQRAGGRGSQEAE